MKTGSQTTVKTRNSPNCRGYSVTVSIVAFNILAIEIANKISKNHSGSSGGQ